jgi:uncharacterized protein YwgA
MGNMADVKERTLEEKTIDKLLLLYILNKHDIGGKTKLQKNIFFIEDSLNSEKIKAFSYNFIKLHFGEYSRELESDLKELFKNGLVTSGGKPTDKSIEVLRKIENDVAKNSRAISKVNAISKWASERPLEVVRKVAYRVSRNGVPLEDIPEETVLLQKLEEPQAKEKLVIDRGWLGTLELLFDREAGESLSIAIKQKPGAILRV